MARVPFLNWAGSMTAIPGTGGGGGGDQNLFGFGPPRYSYSLANDDTLQSILTGLTMIMYGPPDENGKYANPSILPPEKQQPIAKEFGMTPELLNWGNAFAGQHQGQVPSGPDFVDWQYSMAHPGTGKGGGWTERDWMMNWYRQNGILPPPDWVGMPKGSW